MLKTYTTYFIDKCNRIFTRTINPKQATGGYFRTEDGRFYKRKRYYLEDWIFVEEGADEETIDKVGTLRLQERANELKLDQIIANKDRY